MLGIFCAVSALGVPIYSRTVRLILLIIALSIAPLVHAVEKGPCKRLLGELNLRDDVPGLTLGNTHLVYDTNGKLIRGHEPVKNAHQLTEIGVTDVVIFKKDNSGEVGREIAALRELGVPADRIHHIEMPWKDIQNPEIPCRQTVEAINLLTHVAQVPGRVGYFHCSAGQDRTGMLAGLLRMMTQGWTAEDAFFREMCGHGYGFGDAGRPAAVSGAVEANLTPIFLRLASRIEGRGFAAGKTLDPGLCAGDAPRSHLDPATFKCR